MACNPASKFDVGYLIYLLVTLQLMNNQILTGNGRVRGDYEGSVDILSLQYTHNF